MGFRGPLRRGLGSAGEHCASSGDSEHAGAIACLGGWDHSAEQLWPAPDDREGDLNKHPADRWLDEIGEAARTQLLALDRPAVIGHGDWYSRTFAGSVDTCTSCMTGTASSLSPRLL